MAEVTYSTDSETTPSPDTASVEHSAPHRVGRPRRGTAPGRNDALMEAATRVFLRDGYGQASIDKVASEAGVSTRTIYERFKNKADLLAAVITRLVDRDMQGVLATADLDRLDPKDALTAIAGIIAARMRDPESAALIRIVATEAQRFPELAEKMRESSKQRWCDAIARYFDVQIARGTLALADSDRAARLFLQMICAELQECVLFGRAEEVTHIDLTPHLRQAIDIFLYGAAPRADRSRPAGRGS